ncbi:ATP-binding protein (plasmid) [Streptomyces sp. NBC_01527]|uniref:ATP-binding protein n=1 Tax=Streptomyces sp. NBC_01527 TaxID=2903894 RepID=UPI002F90DCEB
MTTAPADRTSAPGDEPKLRYPMAPDYVRDWTAKRALKEFVSNAIDASATYEVSWADGQLTVEDEGPGIPYEGLLFGGSQKDTRHIGQFGEGKKLALLVLARDPQIGEVAVETVGYRFTADLEESDLLKHIGAASTDRNPKVLVLTFSDSDRRTGTRITVECDRRLADELISEVRYLNEPGYTPPQEHAEIILDGDPGRIWVGGILVTTDPRLIASYDLPLATAKHHQNRDRTIVSTSVLEQHIRNALAQCTDPRVLIQFVEHALSGGDLAGPEAFFSRVTSSNYDVRQTFRQLAKDRWPDGRIYHSSTGAAHEAELGLQDLGWECVTTGLNPSEHRSLMNLLGVGDPPRAAAISRTREAPQPTTVWTTIGNLTHPQRRTLDLARGILEATYGRGCLGSLRVFLHHEFGYDGCSARGFYVAGTDTIAVHVGDLDELTDTLETLFHEHGHRFAARNPGFVTNADRTRDFEEALGRTAAQALIQLGNHEQRSFPLSDTAVWDADKLPTGAYLTTRHTDPNRISTAKLRRQHQTALAPEPRRLLAQLAGDRMAAVRKETGKTLGQLMGEFALQARHFGLITRPHPAGYRRSHGFATLPDYQKSVNLGRLLDIHPPVFYLAHIAVEGPIYNVRKASGPWREPLAYGASCAVHDLRELGGLYAQKADAIKDMAAGKTEYDTDGRWLTPVIELINAEIARLA